jgi:hypothetical protein
VAPLAGNPVGADDEAPVDDDAAADPGAEDDAEHAAVAGGRAVGRLRQGEAVGVVGESRLAAERCGDVAGERPADQPGRIGVLDEAVFGDRAGNADADRSADPGLAFDRRDQPGDRRDRAGIIARRGRHAAAPAQPAAAVDQGRFDLAAAEVDADAKAAGHPVPRLRSRQGYMAGPVRQAAPRLPNLKRIGARTLRGQCNPPHTGARRE